MNSKISIIIPVYNVEKYLNRCIESIVNQTYKNIEIILINDGSTDNSQKILNEYKKYKNIFVYKKNNGGLSSARNYGLKYVTGDYIMFVDSDDWIDINCIENLVSYLCTNKNIDIIEFGYRNVNDAGIINQHKFDNKQIDDNNNILYEYFYGNTIVDMVCNKIYKATLFDNLMFVEGKIHEDYMITPKLLYKSNNISIISDVYYNYYRRDNSITNSKYTEKKLDRLFAGEYVVDFCRANCPQFLDIAKIKYAFICIYSYYDLFNAKNINKNDYKKYENIIVKKYKEIFIQIRECKSINKLTFYRKMLLYIFNINKRVSIIIYGLLRGKKQ